MEFVLFKRLSELQGVSHAKDKTLREQSDRRQFERNFIENDFSNIPEEAANKLIGANFNTSKFFFFVVK